MKRRLLASILSFVMVLSLLPTAAWAVDGEDETGSDDGVVLYTGSENTDLTDEGEDGEGAEPTAEAPQWNFAPQYGNLIHDYSYYFNSSYNNETEGYPGVTGYNPKNAISLRDNKLPDEVNTVGLAQRFINAYPHELDGGRRQRIGVARALAVNQEFIVCDEPVSALDVSIQVQILNLMMDLQDELGLTYVFITHDLSVVKHISDEIAVMYLGQCVERVSSKELFQNPLHPYTKALLSAILIPDLSTRGRKKHPVLIRRTESIPSSTWKRAAYIRAIQAHGKRTLCFPASAELTAVRLAMRSPVRRKPL